MVVKTEGKHAGEFIISLANGDRSRDAVRLKQNQDLADGTVLEKDETGDYIAVTIERNSAGEIVAPSDLVVLFGNWNTTASGPYGNADKDGVPVVSGDAEVRESGLVFPAETSEGGEKQAVIDALNAKGIKVR